MDELGPILATVVALAVGYFIGGLGEKRRRKSSLVDERLRAIDKALDLLDELSARLAHDRAEAVGLYSENTGVIGAGIAAADALASPELATRVLATRIREAFSLLQPFDPNDGSEAQFVDKLAEARREYEALKTKLP